MKKYIKENIKPLLIGFICAIIYRDTYTIIESIILKIALINS